MEIAGPAAAGLPVLGSGVIDEHWHGRKDRHMEADFHDDAITDLFGDGNDEDAFSVVGVDQMVHLVQV